MSAIANWMEQLGADELERRLGLRARYPTVALGLDQEQAMLIRTRRHRGKTQLEAVQSRPLDRETMPGTMFQPHRVAIDGLRKTFQDLFTATGTKPGKVSLVIPDNLAKISLIQLPERAGNRRQMDEIVHAKMRRAVPFRLADARISWQELPSSGDSVTLLVVLVRRAVLEPLEAALEGAGARVGLVDISTPNVINLFQEQLDGLAGEGGDVALLNSTPNYFSLAILRGGQLIFFRCKSYAALQEEGYAPNGVLSREVSNSMAYYREKLSGTEVRAVGVRAIGPGGDALPEKLRVAGIENVVMLDPSKVVEISSGANVDANSLQMIAPMLGAAAGSR